MSGVLCAIAGATGTVSYTGTATVTVGYYNPSSLVDYYGFNPQAGSVSPSTWADSGLPFRILDYYHEYSVGLTGVVFYVTGYAPNAGWTTMDVAGTSYSRSSASYGYDGTYTSWVWSPASTNPYGTTVGATKVVTWS